MEESLKIRDSNGRLIEDSGFCLGMFGNFAVVPKCNIAESLRSSEMSFTVFKLLNENYQLKKKQLRLKKKTENRSILVLSCANGPLSYLLK